MSKAMIKVTQVRSIHGRLQKHKACVAGLGLRRIGHTVFIRILTVKKLKVLYPFN